MKKEECRKETVKVSPEDLDKEVTVEALKHLKHVTEKYVEDINSMFHTYKKEFSAFETGLTLSLNVAETPVIVIAIGSAMGVKLSMTELFESVTKEDING